MVNAAMDSVLDTFDGGDALVIGVFDHAHLRHRVGQSNELGRSVAAGDHHVGFRGPVGDGVEDLAETEAVRLKLSD